MKQLTSKTKPFSIRFTDDERAILERAAGSKPLGAFVRDKLLDDYVSPRKAMSKPQKDYRLLAQILAVLGSSECCRQIHHSLDSWLAPTGQCLANSGSSLIRSDVMF